MGRKRKGQRKTESDDASEKQQSQQQTQPSQPQKQPSQPQKQQQPPSHSGGPSTSQDQPQQQALRPTQQPQREEVQTEFAQGRGAERGGGGRGMGRGQALPQLGQQPSRHQQYQTQQHEPQPYSAGRGGRGVERGRGAERGIGQHQPQQSSQPQQYQQRRDESQQQAWGGRGRGQPDVSLAQPGVQGEIKSPGKGRGLGRGDGRGRGGVENPRPQQSPLGSEMSLSITPSSSSSSISRGALENTPMQADNRLEITAAVQRVSIGDTGTQMPPRPITAAGDAPLELVPQTSDVSRIGGKECKFGTTVITNFFPLNIGKLQTAVHYDVAIEPDKPKKLFRLVMEEFRKKKYKHRWPAYDGNKNLYSSSPLFNGTEVSDTVKVMEDERQKEFTVTVKFATQVDLTCLQNYTQQTKGKSIFSMDKPMQALQCIDIVLRSAPALSCIPVGRSYFTRPDREFKLGDGCVLYHGFYQAAILGWKPFVNVDIAHKAFPSALNMIDLIKEMFENVDLNSEIRPYDIKEISRHMKQLKVQYEIPRNPASRRVYRVNDVDTASSKATFKDESGVTMTVAQYFKEKKNAALRYPNLPTLWVGARNRPNKILLPFEYCTILPDQAVNKKMTENQTRNMIRKAATNTDDRLENIRRSVRNADYDRSPSLREFGISVNPTPQEVPARILQPPTLQYNNKTETVYKGVWRANKFSQAIKLTNWSVLCLDIRTRDEKIQALEQQLMRAAVGLGMVIGPPAPFTRVTDRNLAAGLRKYFNSYKYQMVVVILSNKNESYNYVKQASEIAIGCLTQCIKPNTVFRLNPSTVGNILLKINAKLNGENHSLCGLKIFLQKPCMLMGADVTHPGPESRDFPSVAAVTASFDCSFFKYTFEWRLQPAREEIIGDLKEITRSHLMNFYRRNNGTKPEKIIYVRDGVSDGQFVQVLTTELTAIRTACQSLHVNYKPSIVFIVVQKRHHTRFFPKDKRISEDRNFNVPAGTCVDTEITHPSIVDFYLVSHASIQGVAKPTKYVKLWDDCNMSEDDVEKLMYHLCHMFARCTRSVSYPAPTYYAHLAAARARVYCEIDRINMNELPREQQRLTINENISKGLPMFFV